MLSLMLRSKLLSTCNNQWKYCIPGVLLECTFTDRKLHAAVCTNNPCKSTSEKKSASVACTNHSIEVSMSTTSSKKATDSAGGGCPTKQQGNLLKRAKLSKVRLGFLPAEWFTFMEQKTGISGPYILCLGLANYLVSKEIYVMEHEYYSGLGILVTVLLIYIKMGDSIAAYLDKMVDANIKVMEDERKQELSIFDNIIKQAKDAQWRAEGQKLLIDAKKENVLLQLEAAYRDRAMQVYRSVMGRLDYQVKRSAAEARIHQRWMIHWILDNVHRAITPDFQKLSLASAIADLETLAKSSK